MKTRSLSYAEEIAGAGMLTVVVQTFILGIF